MTARSLKDWLIYLEQIHPRMIDMGLERVQQVRLAADLHPQFPVITVGGTNGKGSVCAMLEAILSEAGYRVGCYTSPHLLRFNERIRIHRQEAPDEAICAAFSAIESARQMHQTSLTYFEVGTLAAMWLFIRQSVEVAILEVGLGGRLDAVNAFDPDCAVVTSIDLDHQDYLGNTRGAIGLEKIGIFRKHKPAVCAEPEIPFIVRQHMQEMGANLFLLNEHFSYQSEDLCWHYQGHHRQDCNLPLPALNGACQLQNASAVLATLEAMEAKLPVAQDCIRRGLERVSLTGRFQQIAINPAVVVDVAHNPGAVRQLAANLNAAVPDGQTIAVVAMLKDKDIVSTIRELVGSVDCWVVAGLEVSRGASAKEMQVALRQAGIDHKCLIGVFSNVSLAYAYACDYANENDRICVFGSFHTVGAVLEVFAAINR
ncbi:bifunctional tetrahydrofolate synthase/dihydrofolate synthase [Nitrosomonas mobilis]|nr:bifunctional tetrahydrofolate synthase/dihydrofolate synthase [Nitrosomonas mobilis]HNO74652.1 bifunctional tetrahydrofolate synthase/dihydrofolate synthase [Nitrosomonas mobilis]